MSQQPYDLLVLGSGPAGGSAAFAAAEQGRRVALVERDKIGGTCLHYGCDPTKALLHTAHLLHGARHAGRYGLHIPAATADWTAIQRRLHTIIDQMRGGDDTHVHRTMAEKGIDVVIGEASFLSPNEIVVGDRRLRGEQIVIATGSQTVVPDIKGLHKAGFLTNREAIWLPELPKRLAILGGGPIGIEFAQIFSRFGVEVTMLEQAPTILAKDDRELADLLCGLLGDEGIRIETEVEVEQVVCEGGGKRLTGKRKQETLEFYADEILVATGFKPKLDSIGLEFAGVETNDRGVAVDPTMRTSVPHIWAAGDAAGGYQFTPVAVEQGRLVARNAFEKTPQTFDDRAIPWVTYTEIELAHVGKTEEELKESGIAYTIGRKAMREVERAIAIGQTDGLIKLLVGDDGRLLGGHILAANAGELIAPVALAMRNEIPASALATLIMPYPTLVEGLRSAIEALPNTQ